MLLVDNPSLTPSLLISLEMISFALRNSLMNLPLNTKIFSKSINIILIKYLRFNLLKLNEYKCGISKWLNSGF